jgi:hypothetical protein
MALTKVNNDLLTLDAAQPTITSTGTLTNFTSTGIDDNATSTAITITSDEKVGINLANPSAYYADFSNLVLGNTSANSGMTIVSSTSNSGTIAFSDGTSGTEAYRGYIQYNHATDALMLGSLATERMVIDASGVVTMPSQPAFLIRAAGLNNLPLGYSTLTFDNEKFDVGANFASNTFTAPVTGKYQLSFIAMFTAIDNNAAFIDFLLTTSNNVFENAQDFGVHTGTAVYSSFGISILADMDAGDTAICQYYQSGGNATADFSGASYFSGYLAC